MRVGIDPGARGGLVALDATKYKILEYFNFHKSAPEQIFTFLKKYKNEIISLNLEAVHSIFGVSAKSNFSFGRNVGSIETIVHLSGVPFSKIPPKIWQKPLFVGLEKSLKAKEKSKIVFLRLFPDYRNVDYKIDDGLIDATLLALYKVQGENFES